jgi:plastocyanin domain-containing protein
MIRTALVSMVLALAAGSACKKDDAPSAKPAAAAPAPTTAGTVGSDGVRRIAIEASAKGYEPDHIAGKPGEKLGLEFTRIDDTECISQVKTPDGKLVDLPKGKAVEVAVTVPPSGQLGFACGMDMYHGYVVAQP